MTRYSDEKSAPPTGTMRDHASSHDQLLSRELVRDRYAAYNWAGDHGRLDKLAACFTEDGTLEARGAFTAHGRENIIAELRRTAANFDFSSISESGHRPVIRHFVANLHFQKTSADRIESRAYFAVYNADAPDHWGSYRDVLVRTDEDWLFEHRLVIVEGSVTGSTADRLVPHLSRK